jgi:hypothetical protein
VIINTHILSLHLFKDRITVIYLKKGEYLQPMVGVVEKWLLKDEPSYKAILVEADVLSRFLAKPLNMIPLTVGIYDSLYGRFLAKPLNMIPCTVGFLRNLLIRSLLQSWFLII